MYNDIIESIKNHIDHWWHSLLEWLPRLLVILLLLLAGYLIALLVRRVSFKLIMQLEKMIPAKKMHQTLRPLGLSASAPTLISGLLFWIILLFSVTIVSDLLGLKLVTNWLESLSTYLPNLLAAALVGIIGFSVAIVIRDSLQKSLLGTQLENGARIVYWLVVVITLFLIAGQLRFDIQILTMSSVVILGVTLSGAALAFGLGARLIVTNILCTHYLHKLFKIGDVVAIENVKGTVVEMTPVAVIINTDKGNAVIPSKNFLESASLIHRKS